MKDFKGIAYAIIAAITFGLIPMFAVPVLKAGNIDTVSVLFYRFLFAAVIMGFLTILAGRSFKIKLKELVALSMFGLSYTFTALGLLYSYNLIPSGIATTIHSMYPITVTVFSIVFLKEKVSPKVLLAVLGCITGVFLMCWSSGATSVLGIVIVSSTVISYTAYLLMMSKSSIKNLDPMPLNFYVMGFAALAVFSISPLLTPDGIAPITVRSDFINLLLLALIPTVISNIVLIMAVKRAGATKTAIMGSFEPVAALAVGVVYFNEVLTSTGVLGFIIILVSITFVIIQSTKHKA